MWRRCSARPIIWQADAAHHERIGCSSRPHRVFAGEAGNSSGVTAFVGRGLPRERSVDKQTKHEITLVAIASLVPIPLITAAVVTIILS